MGFGKYLESAVSEVPVRLALCGGHTDRDFWMVCSVAELNSLSKCCARAEAAMHPQLAPVPRAPPQAKGRTGEAIGRLCQLAPATALLLDEAGGGEREVPTSLLHRGDLIKVGGCAVWRCHSACAPQ